LNQYDATAQHVSGDVALVAYAVNRTAPGPHGHWYQAFVVCSRDAGASWVCLPLVRTIRSCFRYWGYPVWPPESIDDVGVEGDAVRIGFRDAEVIFEPGGESMWTGTRSRRGLWTVRRVRLMDYDGKDVSRPPPPIVVDLPAGFRPPPPQLLDQLAARLAGDTRTRVVDRLAWPAAIVAAAPTVIWGTGWQLLLSVVTVVVGLPVLAILVERHRHRRTVSLR
jgi:hypothetical protein